MAWLAVVPVWPRGCDRSVGDAPRISTKGPVSACIRVAVIGGALSVDDEVCVAGPSHASPDSHASSAEEIHDCAGLPAPNNTFDEGVATLQLWEVVNHAGVENVTAVKVRVAAAGT